MKRGPQNDLEPGLEKHGKNESPTKLVVLYVAFIAIPAMLFVGIGFRSILRQWRVMIAPSESAIRIQGQKLAIDIEDRATNIARECLQDKAAMRLSALAALKSPDQPQQIRRVLEDIASRHPIARYTFVVRNGSVQYPLLRTAPTSPLTNAAITADAGKKFAGLLAQADSQQNNGRFAEALKIYRQLQSLDVSVPLRALVLSRMARCSQRMKAVDLADRYYSQLISDFGDVYDPAHAPYALTAALALDPSDFSAHQQLLAVQTDLVNGRWDISAEQAEQFRAQMRTRLGENASESMTRYLDGFEVARALDATIRRKGTSARRIGDEASDDHRPTRNGDVFALAFEGRQDRYQSYYVVLSSDPANQVYWGFTVDMDWMEKEVLADLGAGGAFTIIAKDDKGRGGFKVGFEKLFPYWGLTLTSSFVRSSTLNNNLLVLAGSSFLLLLIGVGFLLLHRTFQQERHIGRMRMDFVNGVSHELKSPITLMRLYSDLLIDDPALSEQSREYTEIIRTEAQRLTSLIENVLDYSRVDKGLRQYHFTVGDISPIVKRNIKVCEDYLATRNFRVYAQIRENLPAVKFDVDAVPSLVLNLIDNAVKYSGQSNSIRVDLRCSGQQVIFSVEDNGVGIPESEREKIFLPYYRANSSEPRGGCGLGLFLIKDIMEAHGGKIELTSQVGSGSCFRLIFPVIETNALAKESLREEEVFAD